MQICTSGAWAAICNIWRLEMVRNQPKHSSRIIEAAKTITLQRELSHQRINSALVPSVVMLRIVWGNNLMIMCCFHLGKEIKLIEIRRRLSIISSGMQKLCKIGQKRQQLNLTFTEVMKASLQRHPYHEKSQVVSHLILVWRNPEYHCYITQWQPLRSMFNNKIFHKTSLPLRVFWRRKKLKQAEGYHRKSF